MIEFTEKEATEALNRVAATDDGRLVLASIMLEMRWNDVLLSFDSEDNTMYHHARRGVWAGLRKYIRPAYLKKIEFDYKRKAESNERRDDDNSSTEQRTKRAERPSAKRAKRKPTDERA